MVQKMLTASVFVNIPVKSIAKAYTYSVPAELSFLDAGWRVFVPFGGRKVEGFILSVEEKNEADKKVNNQQHSNNINNMYEINKKNINNDNNINNTKENDKNNSVEKD